MNTHTNHAGCLVRMQLLAPQVRGRCKILLFYQGGPQGLHCSQPYFERQGLNPRELKNIHGIGFKEIWATVVGFTAPQTPTLPFRLGYSWGCHVQDSCPATRGQSASLSPGRERRGKPGGKPPSRLLSECHGFKKTGHTIRAPESVSLS